MGAIQVLRNAMRGGRVCGSVQISIKLQRCMLQCYYLVLALRGLCVHVNKYLGYTLKKNPNFVEPVGCNVCFSLR